MTMTPETSHPTLLVDDGSGAIDAPIRDALLRLGMLSDDQTRRVEAHRTERSVDFDAAALELGFISH